jgi:hypothetical protein
MLARGAHLHFQVPPVCLLSHSELFEKVAPNGAKGTHVGVADSISQPEKETRDASREQLLKIHAARFAFPASARSDDEIVFPGNDWLDQVQHEFRAVAAVAIEKNNDATFGWKGPYTGGASPPIPGKWFDDDARTGFTGSRRGLIGTAVINHNNFAGYTGRGNGANDIGNRLLLVQRRNDDGNVPFDAVGRRHSRTSHALVK